MYEKKFIYSSCFFRAFIYRLRKKMKRSLKRRLRLLAYKKTTQKTRNEEGIYRTILSNSLKYNDVSTAILACHYLLAINPQNNALKDTLAMLYFESRSFLQSIMLAGEILQSNPDNVKMLEVQAIAQQNLGLIKESLDSYEKLYKKNKIFIPRLSNC
ncbi:MAG: hypothetical protein KatS3mg035_0599 [Bacteroidia bacterium]|nr:MAG: hypothetical protein KatS3mg035_0599 [Bacteroidia bacterium]